MKNLHDLFVSELRDIYYAEKKILEELPHMAKKATSSDLVKAFEKHTEETQGHVERLEKVFKLLDLEPRGQKCPVIEGLMEESKEMMEKVQNDELMDVLLIVSAQKVEHYEISSYGSLCEFADIMGHNEILDLLEETLDEEESTDEKLSEIGDDVNEKAL